MDVYNIKHWAEAGLSRQSWQEMKGGQRNQQIQNSATPPAGAQHQYQGQRILSNLTALTAAAEKLGVTEQDLQNALTSSGGGPQNLTAAAQQLGVNRDKLVAALGFPAGGTGMRGGRNATAMQTSSP
jgi:hypothetical protein